MFNLIFQELGLQVLVLAAGRGIGKLLLLDGARLLLFVGHLLREFGLDDREGQVEQEEGADEDDWVEVDEDPTTNGLKEGDHEGCPAFHGNDLEHLHHRKHHVIEVGGSIGWVFVRLPAIVAGETGFSTATVRHTWIYDTCLFIEAPLLKSSCEKLAASDSKDQEKEHQHKD